MLLKHRAETKVLPMDYGCGSTQGIEYRVSEAWGNCITVRGIVWL